jgi:hypothetical protein
LNFNFDPKLKAIVVDWFNGPLVINFDSPGGTVVGFEEAINEIYEGRSSKKIISYVNPYAASAAFGLASAGHLSPIASLLPMAGLMKKGLPMRSMPRSRTGKIRAFEALSFSGPVCRKTAILMIKKYGKKKKAMRLLMHWWPWQQDNNTGHTTL